MRSSTVPSLPLQLVFPGKMFIKLVPGFGRASDQESHVYCPDPGSSGAPRCTAQ
jgi:hypothetical protein